MSELAKWVEILWGFMNYNFKLNLKVSAFYLEKQKSFIPKKIFLKPLSISKQKSFVYWPNFQWRFCFKPSPMCSVIYQWIKLKYNVKIEVLLLFQLYKGVITSRFHKFCLLNTAPSSTLWTGNILMSFIYKFSSSFIIYN